MKPASNWKIKLLLLKKAGNADIQLAHLNDCSKYHINSPARLKSYHDALLFIKAYPFSAKAYQQADAELTRLLNILDNQKENQRWQHALSGSGLPYSELRCQFSATIVQWLLHRFPGQIVPVESEANAVEFQEFCQSVLPGIEFHQTTQRKLNTWNRIKCLSGEYKNADALQWLLNIIEQQNWTPLVKTQVYDRLKIFISWKSTDALTGRSLLQWPVNSIEYRKTVPIKMNCRDIILKKVAKPICLTLEEKDSLTSLIRTSLALYARETDPVTFADVSETTMFDLGNGFQIALTGMNKERRLSIESYIGYMAFKNGLPVSYGGGWIWGYRCKIGINIYPPFRGAESDLLFCQVLRLFYQVFHVSLFVVKPYQFGKGNPEGLKSGAFWFYYKLGFRPVNESIKTRAALEWEKISADNKYRTSLSILRRFTACNKEWEPVKKVHIHIDADRVSNCVTQMIIHQFKGNRIHAMEIAMNNLIKFTGRKFTPKSGPVELKVWQNWSLLFLSLPDTSTWSQQDRYQFVQLLELKAKGNEIEFIHLLQEHKSFWRSLKQLLHP